MNQKKMALVVGASGIIGNALVETLAAHPDWDVRALRSTDVPGVHTINADLHDADGTAAAMRNAADTTHVFYAALAPQPNLAEEERVNLQMFRHLLDGLHSAGAPVQRVVLYQGAKVYGVHLGTVKAPFYEDDPRHLGPNFYYAQEDFLRSRAERDDFEWSILRPDVVVGSAAGNPMNIAVITATFAALSKSRRLPLRFPGSWKTYRDVLAQVTDAGWLARASLWAAVAPSARNEAFNLVGEPFRWERIWHQVAAAFDMDIADPQPMCLAKQMPTFNEEWAQLTSRHNLRTLPLDRIVSWNFGDFVLNCEFDIISDMGKIRRAGFVEPIDHDHGFQAAISQLQEKRIIPVL